MGRARDEKVRRRRMVAWKLFICSVETNRYRLEQAVHNLSYPKSVLSFAGTRSYNVASFCLVRRKNEPFLLKELGEGQ